MDREVAMHRLIKFRAVRLDGKGFVFGGYFQHTPDEDGVRYYIFDFNEGAIEVIPETVGQFTGLLDKYGTEIYEGDRVKHGNNIFIVRHSNNRHVLVLKKENDTGMNWRDLEWLGRLKKYITVENYIHEGKETNS